MADLSQTSEESLQIDCNAESQSLELQSFDQENCQNKNSCETCEIDHPEKQVEMVNESDRAADEKQDVNALDDIIQLIELVNTCITNDGTTGKNKYKDGFVFLENLQTQFENIQEEVTEKDKMIVSLVVENSTLKREANTSKEELSQKCQQLEELEKNYTKFQKTINSEKISDKKLPSSTITLENLNSKKNKLQLRFTQLNLQIAKQATSQNDLSSIQRNIISKALQDDVENSLCKLDHKMLLLNECKKNIEEQLELTQSALQKLSDKCIETGNFPTDDTATKSTAPLKQQINFGPSIFTTSTITPVTETVTCTADIAETQSTPTPQRYGNLVQATPTNIRGKRKSPVDSLPQLRPTSFSGFNLNNVSVPSLPYIKPFSAGSHNTREQYPNYTQHYKDPADQIPKPKISRNPSTFPLPQQQQIYNGNSNMLQNTPVIQQYPNLVSQAQNKCAICGMTFFTLEQLKLHDDLVQ